MKKFITSMVLFVAAAMVLSPVASAVDNVSTGSDPKWKTIVPIAAIVVAVIFLAVTIVTKKKD